MKFLERGAGFTSVMLPFLYSGAVCSVAVSSSHLQEARRTMATQSWATTAMWSSSNGHEFANASSLSAPSASRAIFLIRIIFSATRRLLDGNRLLKNIDSATVATCCRRFEANWNRKKSTSKQSRHLDSWSVTSQHWLIGPTQPPNQRRRNRKKTGINTSPIKFANSNRTIPESRGSV